MQEALLDPPSDEEGFGKLWNQLGYVGELLDSVGKAHEDVASMAVNTWYCYVEMPGWRRWLRL